MLVIDQNRNDTYCGRYRICSDLTGSRSRINFFRQRILTKIISMRYRAEIDGLRAVAVLPVILFHAGWSLFSGGFAGIDVFFVISGYLITSIILSEMRKGSFSILEF